VTTALLEIKMAQQRATIILSSDTRQAEAGISRVNSGLSDSKTKALELSTAFNQMNLSIAGSSSTLGALRNLLNTLGLGVAVHQLTEYMDAWQNLNARLKLVTNSYQEFQVAQKGVFDIAQQTRQGLKETADLYYKVADSVRSMGLSQQQVLQHTRAVSQAIVISGSSAESAKAALVQYGQAMASNRLGGDELRSIAEQAPRLFRLIRENLSMTGGAFGATQAQFKALAADGYITTEKMIAAVNRGSKSLESEFSKLPLTIGQAWQLLENQMLKFIGTQGESTGMFTAIANGVKLLSENISDLVNVLGIGVASWAAFKAASSLSAFGEAVSNRKSELIAKEITETKLLQAEKEKQAIAENAAVVLRERRSLARSRAIERELAAEIKVIDASKAKLAQEVEIQAQRDAIIAKEVSAQAERDSLLVRQATRTEEAIILENRMILAEEAKIAQATALNSALASATVASERYSAALELETIAYSNQSAMTLSATALIEAQAVATAHATAMNAAYTASLEIVAIEEGRLVLAERAETIALNQAIAAEESKIIANTALAQSELALSAAKNQANALLLREATVVIPENIRAQREVNRAIGESMTTRMTAANNIVLADRAVASSMGARMATTQAANAVVFANIAATEAQTIAAREQAIANSLTTKTFEFMRGIIPFLTTEFNALTAAMMRNPFTVIAVALTALATAAYAYRDSLISVGNEQATLGSLIEASWNKAANTLSPVAAFFSELKTHISEIKSLIPETGLAIFDDKTVTVSGFLKEGMNWMFGGITKDAASIDQAKKLQSEQQAALDQNEKNAYVGSKATDLLESLRGDAGNLNIVENHQKKIAEIYMKEIRINQIYTKEITKNNALLIQAKKEHNAENQKLAQQAIDDAQKNIILSKSLADQLIQKENDAIAQLNKKETAADKSNPFEKLASNYEKSGAKLDATFEKYASKYRVSVDLLKSIGLVESGLNENVKDSSAHAVGVMQVKPKAYGGGDYGLTEAQLRTTEGSIEAGAKAISMLIDKYKDANLKTIVALYHEGETAVSRANMKAHGGNLDLTTLPSKEGRDYVGKVEQANKALKGNFSEIESGVKSQADALKKSEDDLNKHFDEQNKLHEKALALKSKYTKESGDKFLVDEQAAWHWLKSQQLTHEQYLQVMSGIAKAREEAFAKKIEPVTNYNATIDELTRNKQSGAISKGDYGLGVAKANAGLMNQYQDVGIPQIPVERAGEVVAAKNVQDAEKSMSSYNEKMKDARQSMLDMGDAGKMAFDGILGGISSVAGAMSSFGKEMEKLNLSFEKQGEAYIKTMGDTSISQKDREDATKTYYKNKEAYESASFKAEISGARQIAGATSKLFGEKSAARKAFHAVEIGMGMIEMAFAAKKMIVDVAAGAANMFAQGGFAGFAGVAAMAAVMGGLGFAMSGSSKTVDNTTAATDPTGTVLGEPTAVSNSLDNIIKTLNDIHASEYPELKAMADNFRGFDREMYKLQQQMSRSTVNFTNMQGMGIPTAPTGAGQSKNPFGSGAAIAGSLAASATLGAAGVGTAVLATVANAAISAGLTTVGGAIGGMATTATGAAISTGMALGATASSAMLVGGAVLGLAGGLVLAGLQYGLGKLLGIGKVKYEQIGEGIVINSGKLMQDGMLSALDASTFRKDIQTTKGWFSDTKRVIETYGQLSGEIAGTLQGVSDNLTGGMLSVAENLNVLDILMYKFTDVASRPFLKIDFFKDGKRVEDTNKALTDQINAWADRTAKNVFGILFSEYQKLNEGMMETVARLSIQIAGVKGAYAKLGFSLGETNLGLIHFSDTMTQIFQSSAKADDGLKNFIAGMNEVYDFATNQGQKAQLGFTKGQQALKDLSLNTDITNTAQVKADILKLSEMNAKNIEDKTTAQEAQRKLKEPVEAFNNPSLAVGTTMEELFKAIGGNRGDWETVFGKDLNKATWATSKWNEATFEKLGAKWKPVADYFDQIEMVKSSAAAQGGASIDIETLTSQLAAADKELEKLGLDSAKIIDATAYLKENQKTSDKLSALQDEYLKKTLTSEQFLKIERSRIIDEQYKDFQGNMLDYANLNEITSAMIKAGFEDITKESKITASQLQRFVWGLEDAAKAISKLTESTKYVKDFKATISDWIIGLRITSLGNTQTQLDAAAKNFSAKMNIINNDFMTADQKRTALSGITGNADQYIQAIRNFYGSNKESADLIQGVIDQVSALPEALDVQQLQLNALDAIKNSVDGVGLDVGSVLQPSLDELQKQYKTANELQPSLMKDALIGALDTYATGILNSFYSGDKNRKDVAAQITSTGIAAASGISNSSNLSEEQKTSTLSALNQATVSAGKFASAYALMPSEENLMLMKNSVTAFTSLISEAFSNITDKNFSMVLVNALGGLSSALNSSNLPLDVMGVLTEGMNNAVGAWSVAAKVGQKESDTLASGVVSYGAYLGKVAGDYTIDDAKKSEIYTSFSDASLKLFTRVSKNVGAEEMKSYTQDFVSVLIGKGVTSEASGIGAMGLISGVSAALGSALTDEYKNQVIDKLLAGTDLFVDGYQDSIGAAGSSADITNAKLSLVTGFEKYISDASGFLAMKDATDITVGITTLNSALNAVIVEAARKISEASQANYNAYAGTNADITGISPSADFSNVALSTAKTFKDIYGASGLAGEISQKDLLKLADFAGISTDSILRVTQIGETLKVYGKNGYSVQGDSLPMFANGGAFTNGIVDRPTAFNMGLMGEAGSEAILPLEEINGSLGVNAIIPKQAANDSNNETAEEIKELRKELKAALEALNRSAQANIRVNQVGFVQLIDENKAQNASLKSIKTTTQEAAYG
jgi:tape measure domain-containing protein